MSNPKSKPAGDADQSIDVHGDKNVVAYRVDTINVGVGASLKEFGEIVEAARPYLRFMAVECRRLPLRGLDPKAADPLAKGKLGLDAVYVGLDTTTEVEESLLQSELKARRNPSAPVEREPVSALRTVADHRRVVLLGNPGSGKTTFLSHVALCFARQQIEPEGKWLGRLVDWPTRERQWLPILFTLRRFVAFVLGKRAEAQRAEAEGRKLAAPEPGTEVLWQYLESALHKDSCSGCLPALKAAAEHGMALVFLDGLDEVATDELRIFVRQCVEAFAIRYPQARLVLTCRTIPYENPKWQLPGIPSFRLAPFDDAKIAAFVKAWFRSHHLDCGMPADQADTKSKKLLLALQDPRRKEMKAFAGNPMLLTVMALLQSDQRELPDNRAELYEEVTRLLLQRWDDTRGDDGAGVAGIPQLLREAGADLNDLQRVLWHLAFRAQASCRGKSDDAVADIPRFDLLKAIRTLHPSRDLGWANRVIETIKERSGLLLEETEDVFRFPHRSFQEYLAAAHLIDGGEDFDLADSLDEVEASGFPDNAVALVDASGYWHEVVLWAAGRTTHVLNQPNDCLALLAELCPDDEPTFGSAWHRIWLAGEALVEMRREKADRSQRGQRLAARIVGLLARLVEGGHLAPRERARAGMALGVLGDLRPGVGCKPAVGKLPQLPDIRWVRIPAGPFLMGCTERDAKYPDEKPQFSCGLIRHEYWIGHYPVTVAQYEAFTREGYDDESLWTRAGWQWRASIRRPGDYSAPFQTLNHPRVGVSWYEAQAFCRWLNRYRAALGVPDAWRIRLPWEAEWERAARGTGGRDYPWTDGGRPEDRCNMGHEVGHTSAVGMYPSGNAADEGPADLSGNVWEWCATRWLGDYRDYEMKVSNESEGEEDRVVRGGAWDVVLDVVRCASRFRNVPWLRFNFLGFRVAASPFL